MSVQILTRTFKGKTYKVRVVADGYRLDRKTYPSLTACAKAITNYRSISGPRFFGTDKKGGAK